MSLTARAWYGKEGPPATGFIRSFDVTPFVESGTVVSDYTDVETGHGPGAIAVAHQGVWVTNASSRTVRVLSAETLEVRAQLELRGNPVAIAASDEWVWVVCLNGFLWRIEPREPRAEGFARLGRGVRGLTADSAGVWIPMRSGRLMRLDPVSEEMIGTTRVGRHPRGVAVCCGGLAWLLVGRGARLIGVDQATGEVVHRVELKPKGVALASNERMVWLATAERRGGNARLSAVDPVSATVVRSVGVLERPRAVTAGDGYVWVVCSEAKRRNGGPIYALGPDDESLRLAVASTYWPLGGLAVSGPLLLAAMNSHGHWGSGVADNPILFGDIGAGAGGHGGGHHG